MSNTGSLPSNQSELQLYRVLQKANLLLYYDTFISQGGDDVQQLVEAGEEEFLEIMALVGMASKPLHVRRLQKSLQEWVSNPALFKQPLGVNNTSNNTSTVGSILAASLQQPILSVPSFFQQTLNSPVVKRETSSPSSSTQQNTVSALTWTPSYNGTSGDRSAISPPPMLSNFSTLQMDISRDETASPIPNSAHLSQEQIDAIADVAEVFCKTLPKVEPKPMNMKKDINRSILAVIDMALDAPDRLSEIYKYSAIYGRFDSNRKKDKPMSLHEVSVNEAAAQICRFHPSLMTRRDELFPLARQVVKLSGYQYSKGHSRMSDQTESRHFSDIGTPNSKVSQKTEERLIEINHELNVIQPKIEELRLQLRQQSEQLLPDSAVDSIESEIIDMTAQQKLLISEQVTLINRQKMANQHLQTRNGERESSSVSGSSSPHSLHGDETYSSPPNKKLNRGTDYIQKSLFDEGLRIAQQYGMSDFAEELKVLQPVDEKDEKIVQKNCGEVRPDRGQGHVTSSHADDGQMSTNDSSVPNRLNNNNDNDNSLNNGASPGKAEYDGFALMKSIVMGQISSSLATPPSSVTETDNVTDASELC